MSWWRPPQSQSNLTPDPDPSQWLCKHCASLDEAYAQSVLVKLQYGNYCERCEQLSREGLYVVLEETGPVTDQSLEPPDPDAGCNVDDGVTADGGNEQ